MSLVNRIVVTCRLENGDTVDASAKITGKQYSDADKRKLLDKIDKQFRPCVEDTLYYNVRTWSGENGKERRNWSRVPNLEALLGVVEEVMGDEKASS